MDISKADYNNLSKYCNIKNQVLKLALSLVLIELIFFIDFFDYFYTLSFNLSKCSATPIYISVKKIGVVIGIAILTNA